jgi:hypothetical protein
LLGSRAEKEWGVVGGVSRAAFGSVEDSIVTRKLRGKKHTALERDQEDDDGLFLNARKVNVLRNALRVYFGRSL